MTQNELSIRLNALKQDLKNRPNDRAVTMIISRHIQLINDCLQYGYSRIDIYNLIFDDNKIKLNYFYNILYRARKRFKTNQQTIDRSTNKESTKKHILNNTQTKSENKSSMNAFERLQSRKNQNNSVIHNSGSTLEDLEDTLARIMKEQES